MKKYSRLIAVIVFFTVAVLTCCPRIADAHASLVTSSPAPGEQFQDVPKEVRLEFNERLDQDLYFIKLFNSSGKEIAGSKTVISKDQKQISLPLPDLNDGLYTVSYRVISADGHPVSGSFIFSVGKDVWVENPNVVNSESILTNNMFFFLRALMYISLVVLIGWIFWRNWSPVSANASGHFNKRVYPLLWLFIFVQILYFSIWLISYEPSSWDAVKSVVFGTPTGLSFVSLLALALLGFLTVGRSVWIDMPWVILMCVSKSIMGHPVSHEPQALSIFLNAVHVLAASIWAGGIMFVVLSWKRHRNETLSFLRTFSSAALICIVGLIFSGTALTLIYEPNMSYLTETAWGWLLIAKITAATVVVILGSFIRSILRKYHDKLRSLLLLDVALMLTIVILASVLTYLNPLPENKPQYWYEMSGSNMITAQFVPVASGEHEFSVSIEFEDTVTAKDVNLILKNRDNTNVSPISVPLERQDGSSGGVYDYHVQGPYPPFPGNWSVQLRVMDSNDDETVYEKEITIY